MISQPATSFSSAPQSCSVSSFRMRCQKAARLASEEVEGRVGLITDACLASGMPPLGRAGAEGRLRPAAEGGVANGTRTRNSQNHNLELYH